LPTIRREAASKRYAVSREDQDARKIHLVRRSRTTSALGLTETAIPRQWRGAIGVFGRKSVFLETIEQVQGLKQPDFSLL
jgi:hypothetical protein